MIAFDTTEASVEQHRASIASRLSALSGTGSASVAPLIVVPGEEEPGNPGDIPTIDAGGLSIARLTSAMRSHGCLIVRGFLPRDEIAQWRSAIDKVLEYCSEQALGKSPTSNPYFAPPENLASVMPRGERELGNTRSFHQESGSAMCVEAPTIAEGLLARYEELGLKSLLSDYFGERPCLSAKKWVLRRSRLPVSEAGWHQDGAFMGTDINSLNLWLPLSACGDSTGAPGLDVLPRRLSRIVSAEGAQFDWSVSSSEVGRKAGKSDIVSPEFAPGDAFFFDHFFLHRTQYRTDFKQLRYAIETWFFGESCVPRNQIPLRW